MKRVISLFLSLALFACLTVPAFAVETAPQQQETIYLEDGSYIVVTLQVDPMTRSSTKSGSKSYTCFNENHVKQWLYTLKGTFTYDGSSSEAVNARASYSIYNRDWKLVESNPYCDGSYAIADAAFESSNDYRSITIEIYCDENGNIS